MELEVVKAWNGVTGSGKDARLAINRNFEALADSILSNGSLEHIVTKTEEEFEALRLSGQLDDHTLYLVLNPRQQSTIEQLIAELTAELDGKANNQAMSEALATLTSALGGKANTQDLVSIAAMVSTTTIAQDPDWRDIFARNGSWFFVDDEHGITRPEGFVVPADGVERGYGVSSWAKTDTAKPTALVKDLTDGGLYILTMESNILISSQRLATIGDLVEGPPGLSAYQDAIVHGFEGTFEEWTAFLKGDPGKSAYQSYLDTTGDEPPMTESEWSNQMDSVDNILDILGGDLIGDIQTVLDNMLDV